MSISDAFRNNLTTRHLEKILGVDLYRGVMDVLVKHLGWEEAPQSALRAFNQSLFFKKECAILIANEILSNEERSYYADKYGRLDFYVSSWKRFLDEYFNKYGVEGFQAKTGDQTNSGDQIIKPFLKDTQLNVDVFLQMHYYQRYMREDILRKYYSSNKRSRFIVHMPTGAGKTKTMMEALIVILDGLPLGKNVIWLAHSKELCKQAEETFTSLYKFKGSGSINISRFYGTGSLELMQGEVNLIFSTYGKAGAYHKKMPLEFYRELCFPNELVVVDEAHKALADKYSELIAKLISTNDRMIGLTATPGRGGDQVQVENRHLANFFDNSMLSIRDRDGNHVSNSFQHLVKNSFLSNIRHEYLSFENGCQLTEKQVEDLLEKGEFSGDLVRSMALNADRTFMIIKKIIHIVEEDSNNRILLFAISTESAKILSTLLNALQVSCGLVLGDDKATERESTIKKFKFNKLNVLVNYGVLTTGFDSTNITHCIISRPTSSPVLYSQMVGRAIRGKKNGGHSQNTIIDVVDNFLKLDSGSKIFVNWNKNYE